MEVLIVDHSAQILQRLEEMLAESKSVTAVHTTNSFTIAADYFAQYHPAIVLIGISMPENEPQRLLPKICAGPHKALVIVLFSNKSQYMNEPCRFPGAQYYLDKYEDFEKIPGIISGVAASDCKK